MQQFAQLANEYASGGAELHAMRDEEQFNGSGAGSDAKAPGVNVG